MRSKLAERLSAPGLRFKALPWSSRLALAFLVVIAIAAIFAPVLAPHDPLETFIPATPPGAEHFFGTDRLGCSMMYSAKSTSLSARSACLMGFSRVSVSPCTSISISVADCDRTFSCMARATWRGYLRKAAARKGRSLLGFTGSHQ